jgi:hypothetical protein
MARIVAKEGWKGRMITPATTRHHGVFDDQQCAARPPGEGEQHTCSDRVHAAGNGEEPAIQFRTGSLIGLQKAPRSTLATCDRPGEPSSAGPLESLQQHLDMRLAAADSDANWRWRQLLATEVPCATADPFLPELAEG